MKSRYFMIRIENQFPAEFSPGRVIETAKVRAVDDVLYLARIVVIENIEDGAAREHFKVPLPRCGA